MKRIIYQALTRLWGNGKFSAWDKASFTYLKSLGVDYLWLTGIPRHESGTEYAKGDPGSPYAVLDWFDVNPYLAKNEDNRLHEFKLLIKRAHSYGIKIIIDYIPNHVARSYQGSLPHFDYWDADWSDTLKLDWGSEKIVPKMTEILEFWAEMGVDGFRCDMVELVSAEKLGELIRAVKADYPELVFVAETYGKDNYRHYLEQAGIDILYDKSGFYDILRAIYWDHCSAKVLTYHWQWLSDMQPRMLNFLENHDEQRLASSYWQKGEYYPKAALAFSALYNDAWFMLYFGQEWGDKALEGHEGRTSIFQWCEPIGPKAAYDYAHKKQLSSNVERELYDTYHEIMSYAQSPLFREGNNWDLCYMQGGMKGWDEYKHFAFLRYKGDKMALVVCNFSSQNAEIELKVPSEFVSFTKASVINVSVPASDYVIINYLSV